ncbi:hypothetical protein [Fontibacillus sp. BL9]
MPACLPLAGDRFFGLTDSRGAEALICGTPAFRLSATWTSFCQAAH